MMIPVLLTRIKTRDGVTLEGIYVKPRSRGKTALVWLHGLSSRFSSGQPLIGELSSRCERLGIGYLKFNTRGHDIVTSEKLPRLSFGGSAFEKFADCGLDIRAMVQFGWKLGYRKFILAGHSTGSNKALYYLYKTRDRSVTGLLLLGPTNDIAYDRKLLGSRELSRRLAVAAKLKRDGRPEALLPQRYGVWTAQRYDTILHAGKSEDVFPYHNPRARWKELRSVRVPLAVIFGSRDEYLDRPAGEVVKIFRAHARSTASFSGIIIKGAHHGFMKKEKELARTIIRWIKRAIV